MIVNMSVWDSVDSLKNFMFRTHHRDFMRRKGDWFHRLPEDTYVLWWIEEDHIPTLEEAIKRLEHLREIGDTPYANQLYGVRSAKIAFIDNQGYVF